MNSEVYKENVQFWDRAWNGVKTPYTQLPELEYIPKIIDCMQNHKPGPILDLGCGSGWLSVFLARNGFTVTGVDLAVHAVELGKMWAEQENLTIDFRAQDISDLEFETSSFQGVVANSIFEHLTFELAGKTTSRLKKLLKMVALLWAALTWLAPDRASITNWKTARTSTQIRAEKECFCAASQTTS